MPRRTKDDAGKTRDAIIDAAETVFYARGVSRTSLEQVAVAAGVTRGAIYWHFADKLALCDAMLARVFLPHEDMLANLAARDSATPLDDLKESYIHSLTLMARDKRRREVCTILMKRCEYVDEMLAIADRANACKARMLALSGKLLTRARKLGQLHKNWTPGLAAAALQAVMHGLIAFGLEQPRAFDFRKTGIPVIEHFFRSLRA